MKNNEDQEVIEQEEIIESYKYGSQLITVSGTRPYLSGKIVKIFIEAFPLGEDKELYQYDGGPKSMSIVGFVSQQQVLRQYLIGDGCMIFQPVQEDEVRAQYVHVAPTIVRPTASPFARISVYVPCHVMHAP